MKTVCFFALLLPTTLATPVTRGERLPNILWISIEDTGTQIGPYGDKLAVTPNLDRLAEEGAVFLNAFSHAPVCAPTRSGIITGVYPTSIGTHNMRSSMVPPAEVKAFPESLRAHGYYTTNNSKTDYNFECPLTAWDENSEEAHWKNRPNEDQPFFAVFNLVSSHEGSVRRQLAARLKDPAKGIHDASQLVLPPYYPDTPKVREAWAAYYDVVTQTDERIGELLRELDDAGLSDGTLVIFWADHGVGLARGKRWLYDSGVKIPLVTRWPGKIKPGSVRADFVQLLDLAPTMLAVAGIDKPAYMQGRVCLGSRIEPAPGRLYHARDRMDERYDMIRAVRDKRYKYIRNVESHKPWVQFMRTPSQGPIYQELRRLKEVGGLNQLTGSFMRDTKPHEELYDTLVDPYETRNLAGDPDFKRILERMRGELIDWMKRTNDHGLIPEPELYRRMYPDNRVERTVAPAVVKMTRQSGAIRLELTSETDGASIAYTVEEGRDVRWQLYTGPVWLEKGCSLRCKAVRIGFEDSQELVVRN